MAHRTMSIFAFNTGSTLEMSVIATESGLTASFVVATLDAAVLSAALASRGITFLGGARRILLCDYALQDLSSQGVFGRFSYRSAG